jgi:membrane AbrB-like protein
MNQTLSFITSLEASTDEQVATAKQNPVNQLIIVALEMLLALPVGLGLAGFHFGGIAWILGGIVSGGLVLQGCRICYSYSPKPNRTARRTGMALVGMYVGFSIAHSNLANIASSFPVFLFLTLFLLIGGGIIGYIYCRLTQTNLLTAMLATVPGGVGPMSAIAADYGRNVALVALVQTLRVTSVVFLFPFIARVSNDGFSSNQILPVKGVLFTLEPFQLGLLLLALLLCGLGVYISLLSKIPAGEFFGAIVVGVAFNPLLNCLPFVGNVEFTPPLLVNIVGQMLLGITIGEYWGNKPTLTKKTIGYALLSVGMTLLTAAIAAILAMQFTDWDWLTCLLVTAPGGSAEMVLVALSLHHNVEIVTAGHLVRLIAINSSLPLWVFLFRHIDGQFSEPAENILVNENNV